MNHDMDREIEQMGRWAICINVLTLLAACVFGLLIWWGGWIFAEWIIWLVRN